MDATNKLCFWHAPQPSQATGSDGRGGYTSSSTPPQQKASQDEKQRVVLEAAAVPQGKQKACLDWFAEQHIDNPTDLAIFKTVGEMFEGVAVPPIMRRLATSIWEAHMNGSKKAAAEKAAADKAHLPLSGTTIKVSTEIVQKQQVFVSFSRPVFFFFLSVVLVFF